MCIEQARRILALILALSFATGLAAGEAPPRVIVLGFDGLDPRLCERWMKDGTLPHLKRLAEQGSYRRLNTSVPCQSPVAWRTFATGVNPGNHGVFDFLRRMPGTYLPDMATVERGTMPVLKEDWKRLGAGALAGFVFGGLAWLAARLLRRKRRVSPVVTCGVLTAVAVSCAIYGWLPREVPTPKNLTGGVPFWAYLGEAGVRCKVLRIPVEFPAREYPSCKVLSGLGVPDVRATNGTYTVYAEDRNGVDENTEMGGRIAPVRFEGVLARAEALGPPNALDPSSGPLACPFTITRTDAGVTVDLNGGIHELEPGQWSPWLDLPFSASPLVKLNGKGRFHLLSRDPLRLYLTPVNFDPSAPPPNLPLSAPLRYAPDLAGANGFYKTLGWPTDTWSLNEGHATDAMYLDDYRETMRMEKAVTLAELERDDWDCLVAVFTPTDQIQHVFQPMENDGGRGETALREAYREADAFVGDVMARFGGGDTTLIVLSDHGFHPFRKAVNINTWLWKNGYLRFEGESPPDAAPRMMADLSGRGEFWDGVDWQNTYAYSMGLGNVYLNLQGREPEGIVRPGEMADLVLAKLREGLLALRDPETGEPVVRSLYAGREIYSGKYAAQSADLVVGFHPGYRVSWQTALGGTPPEIIEPNEKKWAGDHCSLDPAVTPGVLFCSRKVTPRNGSEAKARYAGGGAFPSVMDAAPSLLALFDVKIPDRMEGETWWDDDGVKDRGSVFSDGEGE